MLIAGGTYKHKVSWVEHKVLPKGPITSFSIGEKMKGSKDIYQNYSFTVYDTLEIKNDDSVQIVTIDSIEVNRKVKKDGEIKLYVNLTGTVIVVPNEKTAPEPTQDYSQEPYQEPVQDENGEFELPFDI
jgi:hypothetical protein